MGRWIRHGVWSDRSVHSLLAAADRLTRAVPIFERAGRQRRFAVRVARALVRRSLTRVGLPARRVVGSKTQEASAFVIRLARGGNALPEWVAALADVAVPAIGVFSASVVAMTARVRAGHAAVALHFRRAIPVDSAGAVQRASVDRSEATLRRSRESRGARMDRRAMPDLAVAGSEACFGGIEHDGDRGRASTLGRLRRRRFRVVARVALEVRRLFLRLLGGAAPDEECEGQGRCDGSRATNGGDWAEAHGASEPISRSRRGALRKTSLRLPPTDTQGLAGNFQG